MSGGHFDYKQHHIRDISDEVEQLILINNSEEKDEFGFVKGNFYSDEVIDEFKRGLKVLKDSEVFTRRIDWLVSGDDGEKSFLERLENELKENERYLD